MGRHVQLPWLDPDVLQTRAHRAGRAREIAGERAHRRAVARELLLPHVLDVDDPLWPRARVRQIGVAERCLAHPLVLRQLLGPRRSHPRPLEARKIGQPRPYADPEGEHVDPLRARDDAMRLLLGEVDEAVAGADLVGRELLTVPLPRQAGSAEHVENLLLVALHVDRRRAFARVDLDPVYAHGNAPGGRAEVGPVRGQLVADLGALALGVFPVRDRGHGPSLGKRAHERSRRGGDDDHGQERRPRERGDSPRGEAR